MVEDGNGDGAVGSGRRRALLLWDAPNVDMTLSDVLGRRPAARDRPQFEVVGRWLLEQAGRVGAEAEACVFLNVPSGNVAVIAPFVHALRVLGYAVFARPKTEPGDDIDEAMLGHLRQRATDDGLAFVALASHDGNAFAEPLDALAARGTDVVVLGFEEYAGWALAAPALRFVDLETIPGCFAQPLDRMSLERLPPEGAWLRPLRPLGDLARQ